MFNILKDYFCHTQLGRNEDHRAKIFSVLSNLEISEATWLTNWTKALYLHNYIMNVILQKTVHFWTFLFQCREFFVETTLVWSLQLISLVGESKTLHNFQSWNMKAIHVFHQSGQCFKLISCGDLSVEIQASRPLQKKSRGRLWPSKIIARSPSLSKTTGNLEFI